MPPDFLAQLKEEMPRRKGHHGWHKVEQLIPKLIGEGYSWETILLGTKNYAKHCQKEGNVGTSFTLMAQTFFGPGHYFEEYAEMDTRTDSEIAEERAWLQLRHRAENCGFRMPREGESAGAYQTLLSRHELDRRNVEPIRRVK